jgi:hypothetical protein
LPELRLALSRWACPFAKAFFSYCSTFRDCPKETKNMLQKLEGLKDVLDVLEDVFQGHEDLQTETPPVKAAKRNILACENGLVQLKDILDNFKATPVDLNRDLINRASYPFKCGAIRAILEHFEGLQSNLDTCNDRSLRCLRHVTQAAAHVDSCDGSFSPSSLLFLSLILSLNTTAIFLSI